MSDSTIKRNFAGGELLRSPALFAVASLVIAIILAESDGLWAYLGRHWTTTFSVPIALGVVMTVILMAVRSKCLPYSLLACLCVFGAMFVDLVAGFQLGLLSGVLLAQIGLLAAGSLPSVVRPEKAVLWILATFIQSVWIRDVLTIGEHISFFGPTWIV